MYLSIRESALRMGVSEKTIRRWISDGVIRGNRVGPRLIRVDAASLETIGRPLAA